MRAQQSLARFSTNGKIFFGLVQLWCLVAIAVFSLRGFFDVNHETIWADFASRPIPPDVVSSGRLSDPFAEPSRGFSHFVQTMINFYLESDGGNKPSERFIIRTTDNPISSKFSSTTSYGNAPGRPAEKKCMCDILSSLDCLDSIHCIPTNSDHVNALVLLGIETRQVLKKTATFNGTVKDSFWKPIGKQLQYSSIFAWHNWRKSGILPKFYDPMKRSDFVDQGRYSYCRDMNLTGKSCFFDKVSEQENLAGAIIERKAVRWLETKYNSREAVMNARGHIGQMMGDFVLQQMPRDDGTNIKPLSPLGFLMMFAHICRLLFNRRSFLEDIFQAHLVTLEPERNASESSEREAFTLSLHIRRGDSCSTKPKRYETNASALDSPPQTSNVRKCYQTKVYMDAVQRVRRFLPDDQPMHVFLSTDDAGDVIEDIKEHHADVFFSVNEWTFLNYSRSHFQYEGDRIEANENKERPILGETAVADLWLLSQGQAFVGHLGSRFGKVAWLLATSRQGRFVPYLSVDGHSK